MLYCEIVLQGRLKVREIVLQYSHCIAEFVLQEAWLQGVCVAIQKLYCEVQCKRQGCLCHKTDSCVATQCWARQQARARGRWAHGWARRARGTLGLAQADAGLVGVGAQAGRRRAGCAGQASAARGARATGARRRGRAWQARGLAKGCALGALSLFLACFDLVFFLSQIF